MAMQDKQNSWCTVYTGVMVLGSEILLGYEYSQKTNGSYILEHWITWR